MTLKSGNYILGSMSQPENLTLYSDSFRDSPFVFTAFAALAEKGLAFELLDVDLRAGQHRQPDYVTRSLTGKVPVLRHGEFWLSESMAIAEYLAENFAFPNYPRIFPANLQDRARCRQVMMWLRTDLLALRKERPTSAIFYPHTRPELLPLSDEAKERAEELIRVAAALIPAGQTSLFADWCIADADLMLMLMRLVSTAYPVPPNLVLYAEAQWARPSTRAFCELVRPSVI